MSHSATFSAARDEWAAIRAEWADLIEAMFTQAEEATRGNLLNQRGRAAHIDPYSLFYGREARAYAYASDELIQWWDHHPRVPFQAYEAGRFHDFQSECALCALHAAEQGVSR